MTLLLLLAMVSAPPAPSGQVVVTSRGPVEFVGLSDWTPDRIRGALGYESVDQLHFCAADLKKRLGFPDVAVVTFADGTTRHKVITVMEPQHRALVVYRARPSATHQILAAWQPLASAARQNFGQDFAFALNRVVKGQPARAADVPWAAALSARVTADDRALAISVLESDQDRIHRMTAAAVLANFPEDDGAWRALVSALRDPEDMVVASSMHVLNGFAAHWPRAVDWKLATVDIRHLLNGTSLFATRTLIDVLVASRIDPRLVPDIIGNDGGHILGAFLKASRVEDRGRVVRLLQQLSGLRDGPEAVIEWERWLKAAAGRGR